MNIFILRTDPLLIVLLVSAIRHQLPGKRRPQKASGSWLVLCLPGLTLDSQPSPHTYLGSMRYLHHMTVLSKLTNQVSGGVGKGGIVS